MLVRDFSGTISANIGLYTPIKYAGDDIVLIYLTLASNNNNERKKHVAESVSKTLIDIKSQYFLK